jgi:Zn-dependent metalloprotease
MKYKYYTMALLTLLTGLGALPASFAQHKAKVLDPNNHEIKSLAKEITGNGWIRFKNELPLKHDELFKKHKGAFGLSAYDQMQVTRAEQDSLNSTHYTYIQYYKGIEVEGGEYTVHTQDGRITMAHGKIAEGLSSPGKASLTEAEALAKALQAVGAKKYAWQDPLAEQQLRQDDKDSSATYYPKGKLLFARASSSGDFDKKLFRMAYLFKINALEPDDAQAVYVDAATGEVFKQYSLRHYADNNFYSLYNGERTMKTKSRGWPYNDYVLNDNSRGLIETKHFSSTSENFWGTTKEINYKSSHWGWYNTNATSAHWATGVSYDYFRNTFGRAGMNGANKEIRVHVNYTARTFYDQRSSSDNILVGNPTGYSDATLDFIGHEYTHGITKYTADLAYSAQPGALNESFSDIFGVMVERSVTGVEDWLIREDVQTVRSLQNPNAYNHPSVYGGAFWQSTDNCSAQPLNDFCWVHYNSGVQNHWFYLLSVGGTQNGVTVQGIGIVNAARIAFRNLDIYMQHLSQYADAREGAIAAARDLFGECSSQHQQTINAWAAVGIGSPASACTPPVSAYISGPSYLYRYQGGTWTVYPSGGDGVNYGYSWYLNTGSGYVYVGSGKSYSYYMPPSGAFYLRADVTSAGRTGYAYYNVYCNDCTTAAASLTATVYPNPATGNYFDVSVAQVSGASSPPGEPVPLAGSAVPIGNLEYVLYNAQGDPVYRGQSSKPQHKIPTHGLPKGFYYLRISSQAGEVTKHVRIDK